MIIKCKFCKREKRIFPSLIKKGGGKFCSTVCYSKSRIGKKGTPFPEEMKKKLSLERKGIHISPNTEFKKGMKPTKSSFKKGHIISRATRKKMSKTHKILGSKPPICRRFGEDNNFWKGGISIEQTRNDYHLKFLESKAGRKKPEYCEICRKRGRICFDHNHKTGEFRGWVCFRCNLILGMIEGNNYNLDIYYDYLKKTN